ncbi:MAG TPA: hypothetical protein VF342_03170 [Alphaproteobacteria bacterium]
MAESQKSDALLEKWRKIEEGTFEPERPPPAHPERVPLYGGISGLPLAIPEFVLCDGLVIRETFAHVMAPYLMAFAKPKKRGAPHPSPWKAARGGLGFDITVEVALAQSSRPTGLDRLNTLWWVLALLRLKTGAPLRMPVVSDIAFAAIPSSSVEPNLWTIEMPPRQFRTIRHPPKEILTEHLEWVRDTLVAGAPLLDDAGFNRAFQTFDSAIWAHSPGSAVIMAWASLETLFRPGRRQITKTLASCIAAFLYPAGPERDRAYQWIERLYEARGNAAHAAQVPEAQQLLDSFELARRSLSKCLDSRSLPEAEELLARWKERR